MHVYGWSCQPDGNAIKVPPIPAVWFYMSPGGGYLPLSCSHYRRGDSSERSGTLVDPLLPGELNRHYGKNFRGNRSDAAFVKNDQHDGHGDIDSGSAVGDQFTITYSVGAASVLTAEKGVEG